MEPIRVAQIIGKMCAGGVESVAFNYYKFLDHDKVQFDFYYDSDSIVVPPQELIDMGARFIEIPPYQKMWRYLPKLLTHFRKNHYKIVHSHMNTLSVFPLCAAWLAGIPVRIAHNHSTPGGSERLRNILKVILKKFSKLFATHYFACSEKAGRWLFGDRCFDKGEVTVIKNAIDFNRFKPNPQAGNGTREKFGPGDSFVVGHVGRITYQKNHRFLIDVFAEIKNLEPNAKLLLVGDGELRGEIQNYAEKKGVLDSMVFVGAVSDPEWYYNAFDVLVFPSHFEGLGLVAIEAQVSGIPCVVSEAVPEEVSISDGCIFLRLSDEAKEWANVAMVLHGAKTILSSNAEEYNLEKKAYILQKEYVSYLNLNGSTFAIKK